MVKVCLLIGLIGPYIMLMGGNFAGAYDDPVFDSAPAAESYGISDREEYIFSHIGEFGETQHPILADARAECYIITMVLTQRPSG